MLRLGRPVGVYPRLEARIAAIHLSSREEAGEESTGCHECGGEKAESCDKAEDEHDGEGGDDDSDNETKYAGSDVDCGCGE